MYNGVGIFIGVDRCGASEEWYDDDSGGCSSGSGDADIDNAIDDDGDGGGVCDDSGGDSGCHIADEYGADVGTAAAEAVFSSA